MASIFICLGRILSPEGAAPSQENTWNDPVHAVQVFCVWLTPNQDLAYVLATGYVAASILLSGFYLRINDMKLAFMRGLSYLSYTK